MFQGYHRDLSQELCMLPTRPFSLFLHDTDLVRNDKFNVTGEKSSLDIRNALNHFSSEAASTLID